MDFLNYFEVHAYIQFGIIIRLCKFWTCYIA